MKTFTFITLLVISLSVVAHFTIFRNKTPTKFNTFLQPTIKKVHVNKRYPVNRRKIAIIGNSLSVPGTYDGILRDEYNIVNIESFASAGGRTGWSEGNLGNERGLNYQFDKVLLKSGKKYEDVIIFGGVVDLDLYPSPMETIKSNLQTLYDKSNAAGMRVIAISVLPWIACDCSNNENQTSEVQKLNQWIATEAKHVDTYVNAYPYFFDQADDFILDERYYNIDDLLHLSKEGNEKLAELIYQTAFK